MIHEKCHVLLIYESMIPSVHLCGDGQLSELQHERRIDYRKKSTLCVTRKDIEWADTVVLCRLDTCFGLKLVQRFHNAQKCVIYMLDDDLLEVPDHLSVSVYYARRDVQKSIRAMIETSDALLSTSPRILKKYCLKNTKAYLVDGFAEDFAEFEPHAEGKIIKIGFAGSLDRQKDVDLILGDALRSIKETYGDRVSFEFLGVKPDCSEEIQAEVLPYMESYDQYRKTIIQRKWDIGLAPMLCAWLQDDLYQHGLCLRRDGRGTMESGHLCLCPLERIWRDEARWGTGGQKADRSVFHCANFMGLWCQWQQFRQNHA